MHSPTSFLTDSMAQYSPCTDSDKTFSLAMRSAANVRTLRNLQVRTTFYSDRERYAYLKEMLWLDDVEEEEIEEDGEKRVRFTIPDPDINSLDFLDEVAQLLFPRAPFTDTMSNVDYEVIQEALSDFLSRTGRKLVRPARS